MNSYLSTSTPSRVVILISGFELFCKAAILLVLFIVIPMNAEIVSHRGPEVEASGDFQVWVNGAEMFTGQAGDRRWQYSFCAFDFDRPVIVKVKFARSIKWIDIMPSILNIEHHVIDDYMFEFAMDEPKKITILINNDRKHAKQC